jgi:hypothetical protein
VTRFVLYGGKGGVGKNVWTVPDESGEVTGFEALERVGRNLAV